MLALFPDARLANGKGDMKSQGELLLHRFA